MLESRLNNQKNTMKTSKLTNANVKNHPTIDAIDAMANNNGNNDIFTAVVNGKRLLASNNKDMSGKSISSNSSSGNSSCSASDRSVSPPSPSAMSKADIVAKLSAIPHPPPPPPPVMPAFHFNNNKSVSPVRNDNSKHHISSVITINNNNINNNYNNKIIDNNNHTNAPNNTSDTTITDMKTISDNSNIVGAAHTRLNVPAKPGVTFSPNLTQSHHESDHHERNGVAFRNKSPAELTAQSRDRRSYIGEQGNITTINGHAQQRNSQSYAQQANAIAAKLQEGEHPVCSVCHVKIGR